MTTVVDGTKFKIYLITEDLEGKKKEKGTFRFWKKGFITYDGIPFTGVIGNHNITPGFKEDGTAKTPWMILSESLNKGEEVEPDQYGFVTMGEAIVKGKPQGTAKMIRAEILDLALPLSGWVNRKTIDGKEVDTLALSFSSADYDYWQDKVKKPYVLENPEIAEKDFIEICKSLSVSYPEFQKFIDTYFASSRENTGAKRKEMFSKLKEKKTKTTTAKRF